MRRAALALAIAGCVHAGDSATTGHQEVGRFEAQTVLASGLRPGGQVEGDALFGGVGVGFALAVAPHARTSAPVSDTAGTVDLSLRASPFGMLGDDHRIDRWFDFGGAAGIGGGLVRTDHLTTLGEAWIGAWAEIGLPGGSSYPAIELSVQRITFGGDARDETAFLVGLAWTAREFVESWNVWE